MILENGDRLFKSWNQYRLLGVDDLPRSVDVYSHAVDIFLLDNKTGEITLNVYLVSSKEIIESCFNIGSGALLTKSGYVLEFFGEKAVFTYLILVVRMMKVIYLKMALLF